METEPEKKEAEVKVKKEEAVAPHKKAGKKWECKLGKICGKNKTTVIAIVILVLLVAGSYVFMKYSQNAKKNDIGVDGIKGKVEQFIKDNSPQGGAGITVKGIVKEIGLYKVTIDANKQEMITYVTTDGGKFFPQVIDLNAKAADAASSTPAVPEKTEAEQKADVPVVDLFVMSYCPYGLQMERGVLPAIESLGNKIKFNLKFVSYTLHGSKEVIENVNQYCIGKTQPAKLDNYLKCFWKDSKGASDACMKSVGINVAQITTCVADTNKQFSPTEKDFSINKDENVKFGVQGSPTFVVNGTTLAAGRDSASVLKAICSGFKNAPKECQAKLSATSPVAGFDDQAAASAGGSAPAASCATN